MKCRISSSCSPLYFDVLPSARNSNPSSYPMTFPSIVIPCEPISLPATGSHLTGFLLKDGHGGTIATNVRAVPASPM